MKTEGVKESRQTLHHKENADCQHCEREREARTDDGLLKVSE